MIGIEILFYVFLPHVPGRCRGAEWRNKAQTPHENPLLTRDISEWVLKWE